MYLRVGRIGAGASLAALDEWTRHGEGDVGASGPDLMLVRSAPARDATSVPLAGAHRMSIARRLWIAGCACTVVACVGARSLYYSELSLPVALHAAIGDAIAVQTMIAVVVLILDPFFFVPPLVVLALLALVRRSWVFARDGERWRLRAGVSVIVWGILALNQGFFDANRYVAAVGWTSLAVMLVPLGRVPAVAGLRPAAVLGGAAGLGLAAAALLAPDLTDAAAILGWGALLVPTVVLGPRLLGLLDRLTLVALALPAVQLLPLVLPAVLGDATVVGEGMAYAYCESPARGAIYAAVPRCGTAPKRIDECKAGVIEEIDARTGDVRALHRPLSDDFYGRLEEPVCLDGVVQVGMNRTVFGGERFDEDVLEMGLDPPHAVRAHLLGEGGGHRVLYDALRDALLYVGDDVPRVHRIDRRTGAVERFEGEGPAREPISSAAIDTARDVVVTVSPRTRMRELSLADFSVLATHVDAGATEVTIDPELHRAIATGFWGVEVFDLQSGRSLARRRTGVIARKATVDPVHDLVYVATTGEGKLHVFERRSMRRLGQIALGFGGRYPHVSSDGRFLFAGNADCHYRWDAAALAGRLRPASAR